MNSYKHKMLAKSVIILTIGLSLFCGEPIPVEDMATAKYEITRAESVNAEKYAPEPYQQAKEALFAAHDLISEKKIPEAKEKAIESQNLAKEAFNLSAPELAKETRAEAETIISEAERAFAEQFAAVEYQNAVDSMNMGDEKVAASEYYGAFQDFENAREEAIKARNLAEAQAEVLAREADSIAEMISEAEQYGARDSAPDMMSRADDNLTAARESLSTLYLKDAYNSLEMARADITQASNAAKNDWAARKRLEAIGAVESAESELVNLKSQLEDAALKEILANNEEAQETLRTSEETLSAAQNALGNSGDLLEVGEFTDSYSQSEEAIRLSTIVKDQIPQLLVLLSSAANERKVEEPKVEEPKVDEPLAEGWKSYTVKLIPERRDCLWRIAEYDSIYGDPTKWTRIYKANKSQIKNPDLIFPGQVFDIPPAAGSLVKPPPAPVQPETHTHDDMQEVAPMESPEGIESMDDGSTSDNAAEIEAPKIEELVEEEPAEEIEEETETQNESEEYETIAPADNI